MTTRLSVDLLFVGLIAAVGGWYTRAPTDPTARAEYLCAPVKAVAGTAAQLEVLISERYTVEPVPPWHLDPGRACVEVLTRSAADG